MRVSALDLDFSFGERKVLHEVNLFAKEGVMIGLIGPNGSGKTTLLKTLSRVLKPKKGVVYINGLDSSTLSQKELAKNLAVVPQDTSVSFDFTVYSIVMMGRTPHIGKAK